ncbi:hypothetical protein [Pseudomonas petrae]|uniref:hypothetical protein n=1 Tax=Pseudomonas petrae TaxID=2912190 RepID=UPI001F180081|nr:hypothetical protein [Pseudomonas petrae]MCF7557751.1 hypothetical protein [Pseudomonas petrae]
MKTIRALRQFSHYHAGNFDQHESRPVADDIADALVDMKLAEVVDGDGTTPADGQPKAKEKVKK